MRTKFFLLFLFAFVYLFADVQTAFAAKFQEASLGLTRQKVGTAVGGTICATPATNQVESSITYAFPDEFTVNSTASNWTVSTSNLPVGSTAWPGINTAVSVTGQSVKFPSGDLNVGLLYCFNFAEANTLTTAATVGNYAGTLLTKDGSSATIDSTLITIPIADNDQVTVRASVGFRPEDIEFDLSSISGTDFNQSALIDYKITYSNPTAVSISPIITVRWELGEVSQTGAFVDILDYAVGSATAGYGGAQPVVDLNNRTISWYITNMPANTPQQEIVFKLWTTSAYTGESRVIMRVNGIMSVSSVSSPWDLVSLNYLFKPGPPGPRAPGFPDGGQLQNTEPYIFRSVELQSVSANQATIKVVTNKPSNIVFRYGTSPNNLSRKFTSIGPKTEHIFELKDLQEKRSYFFRLEVPGTGYVFTEQFTFRTAALSEPLKLADAILVLASDSVIIQSLINSRNTGQKAVIPKNRTIDLNLRVLKNDFLKQINLSLNPENVLGINNVGPLDPGSSEVILSQLSGGEYHGKLLVPSSAGNYQILAKIFDYKGNISQEKLFDIKAVEPFTVFNEEGKPVENARIRLYFYNPTTYVYEYLSPQVTHIKNPAFSEANGNVVLVLPNGKYKAQIEAIGYESLNREFEINPDSGSYPAVVLKKAPYSLTSTIGYYSSTATDFYHALKYYTKAFSTSYRLFDLYAVLTAIMSTFLFISAITVIKHVRFKNLLRFCWDEIRFLVLRSKLISEVSGRVTDENENGIGMVQIYLIDGSGKVIKQTLSGKTGHFRINLPKNVDTYSLTAVKDGFEIQTVDKGLEDPKTVNIKLVKNELTIKRTAALLKVIFKDWVSSVIEAFIIASIVFGIFFLSTLGNRVAPFLALTILNYLTWMLALKRQV